MVLGVNQGCSSKEIEGVGCRMVATDNDPEGGSNSPVADACWVLDLDSGLGLGDSRETGMEFGWTSEDICNVLN